MPMRCKYCGIKVSNKSNYNRHVQAKHKGKELEICTDSDDAGNCKCLEEGCADKNVRFRQCPKLVLHLEQEHGIKVQKVLMNFNTYSDFKKWLYQEEVRQHAQYVGGCGTKKVLSDGFERFYLNCSRSGNGRIRVQSEEFRQRKRSRGKLGFHCTSQIIVTKDVKTGKCKIAYTKTHYGHTPDVQHLKLTKEEKKAIAEKLEAGIPPLQILDTYRKSNGNLRRLDLLSIKDIYNINRAYNIRLNNKGQYDEDDLVSVDLWLQNCRDLGRNPVIFYKKQYEEDTQYNFAINDYCLILMTKIQCEMAVKFGHGIVLVDGIKVYSTNGLDFHLTTVFVMDEFEEQFPVAFMVSSKREMNFIELFFNKILESVGFLGPKYFVTGVTNLYYTVWCNIMNPLTTHLYCSRCTDKAFKDDIKVTNLDKKASLYNTLKEVQVITEEKKFLEQYDEFLITIRSGEDTWHFSDRFCNFYLSNASKWATCYQPEDIKLPLKIERMYNVIKFFYAEKTRDVRIDRSIQALLRYVERKMTYRMRRLAKGDAAINEQNDALFYEQEEEEENLIDFKMDENKVDPSEQYSESVHPQENSESCEQIEILVGNRGDGQFPEVNSVLGDHNYTTSPGSIKLVVMQKPAHDYPDYVKKLQAVGSGVIFDLNNKIYTDHQYKLIAYHLNALKFITSVRDMEEPKKE